MVRAGLLKDLFIVGSFAIIGYARYNQARAENCALRRYATCRQTVTKVIEADLLAAAKAGDQEAFQELTEPYRRELLVHCYRMLGASDDAEDLVQETFLRAWRSLDTFVRPLYFRAWLYKIATNTCLNEIARRSLRSQRILPNTAYPSSQAGEPLAAPLLEPVWLQPLPDAWLPEAPADPEARYAAQERISLAFALALQLLPARQRAALILCDVLDWSASETAELLEMTVSAVNSALHRARETLAAHRSAEDEPTPSSARQRPAPAVLERYVQAMHNADVRGLVSLLKEDAIFTMPPIPTWFRGRGVIGDFLAGGFLSPDAPGRWRLEPANANLQPAFGLYGFDPAKRIYYPFALQVLTFNTAGDEIIEIVSFSDARLFPRFNLALELPPPPEPQP
jgi:RNA polymerase sigma-70 factor, ECF subfamily